MALVEKIVFVTPAQAETLKVLRDKFGYRGFSAVDAMKALGRTNRQSVVCSLSNMVIKGALTRPFNGSLYAIDVTEFLTAPKSVPEPVAVEPETNELDAILAGPIRDTDHALAWLRLFKISVEHVGSRFKIDGRQPVTAEQLVIVAERRRTNKERYPDQYPRLNRLPTDIPDPSPQQRMRKR